MKSMLSFQLISSETRYKIGLVLETQMEKCASHLFPIRLFGGNRIGADTEKYVPDFTSDN